MQNLLGLEVVATRLKGFTPNGQARYELPHTALTVPAMTKLDIFINRATLKILLKGSDWRIMKDDSLRCTSYDVRSVAFLEEVFLKNLARHKATTVEALKATLAV